LQEFAGEQILNPETQANHPILGDFATIPFCNQHVVGSPVRRP
jgi:hypothetical protein